MAGSAYPSNPYAMDHWPVHPGTSKNTSQETLPPYQETGSKNIVVAEKEVAAKTSQPKKQRFSTLKSILSGDVHKHNPHYVLEKAADASAASKDSKPSTPRSESRSGTLKSILTGDVHKHNAHRVLEESVMRKT
ncbi:hypothetical protein H2203_004743 [Taxawa tesnikishii (nom. ined.)]|nr:hypothetical protein H2203_004743 [Dothideales sp. JES 119]